MRAVRRLVGIVLCLVAALGLAASPAAAAQGYTTFHRWPAASVYLACQYSEYGGPYGPVWRVRLVLAHNPNEARLHLRGSFTISRIGSDGRYRPMATTYLATDSVGQWDVQVATGSQIGGYYAGRWYGDRWSVGWGDETGGAGDSSLNSFWNLGHC